MALDVLAADGEVRRACDSVCDTLTPTLPITLDDIAAVWELLGSALGARRSGYRLDVMHDGRELRVNVCRGVERVYERALPANP